MTHNIPENAENAETGFTNSGATAEFLAARDFLLERRGDYEAARTGFTWPRPERFNWALDWFDHIATGNGADALRIVEEDGTSRSVSFGELSVRSASAANWLRDQGVAAGDRVLVMLGNQRELWEVMLGAMKLRAVVIPATPSSARRTCATASSAATSGTSSCVPRTPASSTRSPAPTPGSPPERTYPPDGAGSRTCTRPTPTSARTARRSPPTR